MTYPVPLDTLRDPATPTSFLPSHSTYDALIMFSMRGVFWAPMGEGHFPGQQGYNYVFSLMSLLAILGFMVSSVLYKSVRNKSVAMGGVGAVQS
ncbi:hypothetical protein ABH905_003316 [Pseudomonas frederiksbergensis]